MCDISPGGLYAKLNVSEEHPGRIVCTIRNLPGSNAVIVNQHGTEVIDHQNLSNYLEFHNERTDTNISYHLNITWTQDRRIQEELKVIQCIASFPHCSNDPCRTSIVNISFVEKQLEGIFSIVVYVGIFAM